MILRPNPESGPKEFSDAVGPKLLGVNLRRGELTVLPLHSATWFPKETVRPFQLHPSLLFFCQRKNFVAAFLSLSLSQTPRFRNPNLRCSSTFSYSLCGFFSRTSSHSALSRAVAAAAAAAAAILSRSQVPFSVCLLFFFRLSEYAAFSSSCRGFCFCCFFARGNRCFLRNE